jgi:hypothetical protein
MQFRPAGYRHIKSQDIMAGFILRRYGPKALVAVSDDLKQDSG